MLILPYSSLFSTELRFEPLQVSNLAQMVVDSGYWQIWPVITLWFFAVLSFNAVLLAVVTRILILSAARLRISFGTACRLTSFANTVTAGLLVVQFYVFIELSYLLLLLIPFIYILLFVRQLRVQVATAGAAATGTSQSQEDRPDSSGDREASSGDGVFRP